MSRTRAFGLGLTFEKLLTRHSYSNYSSIQTFTDMGSHDYSSLLNDFSNAYSTFEQNVGYILTSNLLDTSV